MAELDGRIIGLSVSQRIDSQLLHRAGASTCGELTDNGTLRASHRPDGDALFGVNISVDPAWQRCGVGNLLVLGLVVVFLGSNLKYFSTSTRMPDYHSHAERVSPEEYIRLRRPDGKLVDRTLRFWEFAGMRLVGVVKDYYPDPESLNYAAIALWDNPIHFSSRSLARLWRSLYGLVSVERLLFSAAWFSQVFSPRLRRGIAASAPLSSGPTHRARAVARSEASSSRGPDRL